jgi:hypothetical protein
MANAAVVDKIERGEQLKRDGIIIRTWDLMKPGQRYGRR